MRSTAQPTRGPRWPSSPTWPRPVCSSSATPRPSSPTPWHGVGATAPPVALHGRTLADAQHLLQQTVLGNDPLSQKDLPRVRAAKMELLNSDGVLELVPATAGSLAR